MHTVKFTETVFKNSNKKGVLTPDSDGYYEVVLGGLNSYNSVGEYYTADRVVDLFNSSSEFMRRIKSGALYSEIGHPKQLPGMSFQAYYRRVLTIEETNICGHFSEIWLDFEFGKKNPSLNNPNLIGILGKVKPAGAKANALQLALENHRQNAAFSVRGLTDNSVDSSGRVNRRLTTIVTFDHVVEPGISIADKAYSPSLESYKDGTTVEISDTIVDKNILREVLTSKNKSIGLESKETYSDILRFLDSDSNNSRLRKWK